MDKNRRVQFLRNAELRKLVFQQLTNKLDRQPGLVAQSVTQAVARHSLDGILDAWDQCRHWFTREGTRLKAGRHP